MAVTSLSTRPNPTGGFTVIANFSDNLATAVMDEIIREIVVTVAKEYTREHYAEIAAQLDQQAIANLAVAESGRKIAEEIRSRPVVLHDGNKTTINKYSMF